MYMFLIEVKFNLDEDHALEYNLHSTFLANEMTWLPPLRATLSC